MHALLLALLMWFGGPPPPPPPAMPMAEEDDSEVVPPPPVIIVPPQPAFPAVVYDYYAAILLISPWEIPANSNQEPWIWEPVKRMATDAEVVGPHERWVSDFRAEVRYVRAHIRSLQDTPSVVDAYRFPSAETAAENCRFSEQYQAHLQAQLLMQPHRSQDFSDALDETRELHRIWSAVRRANNLDESWVSRRRGLESLRTRLGDEAYYVGRMPPCVPLWRFKEID